MNTRPSLKEIVAFLISFAGLIFMCCEVDGELLDQVATSLTGLVLLLAGPGVWFVWSKLEEVLKRDHR